MSGIDQESFLDIGSIPNSAMRDPSELVWLDVATNDFWWTNYITAVKFTSPKGVVVEMKTEKSLAMTDTGTTCTWIPSKHYNTVFNQLYRMQPGMFNGYDLIDC